MSCPEDSPSKATFTYPAPALPSHSWPWLPWIDINFYSNVTDVLTCCPHITSHNAGKKPHLHLYLSQGSKVHSKDVSLDVTDATVQQSLQDVGVSVCHVGRSNPRARYWYISFYNQFYKEKFPKCFTERKCRLNIINKLIMPEQWRHCHVLTIIIWQVDVEEEDGDNWEVKSFTETSFYFLSIFLSFIDPILSIHANNWIKPGNVFYEKT